MITMLIFSLFLTLTLATHAQSYNCSSIFVFEHSNCQFYFNDTTNCNDFHFQYCKWQRCLHSKLMGNTDICDNYQTNNSTSWQLCTSTCCHSDISYARNWDSVYECQASIDQSYFGTTALSGVMLGLVILMVVLALCCFCYCCRTGCLGCCCGAIRECLISLLRCECLRSGGDARRLDHNVSQDGIAGQNQANQAVYNNSHEWKYASPAEIKQSIENVTCCVCLEDHTGLQLQCGHLLHKECMRECLRSKMQCPVCRSNRISRVRVYCGKCFQAYMCGTLAQMFEQRVAMGGVCERCRQMNVGRG